MHAITERTGVITFPSIRACVKTALMAEQKAFNKMPTSTNWAHLVIWMAAHQQVWSVTKPWVEDKVCAALQGKPLVEWPDAICMAVLGMTAAEVLAG